MKNLYVTRLIGLWALLVSINVSAYDFQSGGIIYTIEGNEVSVSGDASILSGDIVIPSQITYNGKTYSVTSIRYAGFNHCSGLTSITIPNSVTLICEDAFYQCDSLTSVTIGSGVSEIQHGAFRYCHNLNVHISDLTAWCKVRCWSSKKHEGCGNPLMGGGHLYLNGKEIKDLIIPEGVTSIGEGAFYGCDLTSITIPNSVTSIGHDAFYNTTWYQNQPDGVVYVGKIACDYKGIMPANTHITIKDGTLGIADHAFSQCGNLTSVTIPNSVTTIGKDAFSYCSGLTSVTIPNSVTSIGGYAFSGCSGLTSVTIPNSVTSIGGSAFRDCSGLTSITIPNSVTSVGNNAFTGTAWFNNQADGLVYAGKVVYKYKGEMPENTQIILKDGTLEITDEAFSGCSGLTSITIPNSVTSIGSSVFNGCSDLTLVIIPNSVTSIGYGAFYGCSGLTSITIPNSVTSIGGSAFSGCSGLTSVTISNSVTSIGESVFRGCRGLTSIKVENGNRFYDSRNDCNAIIESSSNTLIIGCKNTIIPNSVTSIVSSAFSGCSGLTSITIPNSVTSIGGSAFSGCSGLTSITIGNCVTSIGGYAFSGCSGLTSVTIPNSVISIGNYAFRDCSGLTSITIPNSVTSVGNNAFTGTAWFNNQADGLVYAGKVVYKYKGEMPENTRIILKDGTLGIAIYAFSGCTGLTSVTIPNSVTSIAIDAFQGCSGLTTIVSEIEKPFEIHSYTFTSASYNVAELIVPYGTRAAYQGTGGWNKFTMITEAPDKDAVAFTIDGIAYEGGKSEKTVVVKSVDTKQTSIEIPASVSYDGITYQVSGITDGVFDGSSMAALIWDVEAALPNNAFSNASIDPNFLLYVKSSSYAPSSVKNVIVDGTAQTIVLSDDGGQFYCPQAFTARRISYSHNYSMETGKGSTMGWESIALPFDVQRIIHSTQGEIVPFAAYSSGSNQKPFWLAYMSAGGFKRTVDIRANEAYIIAMPNNSSYQDNYILAGDVTFSAENITVPKTPTFNGTFLPAFSFVAKSSSVYALNVNNRYIRYSGSEKPGSIFIRDLRDVRPFEAYISNSSTRGVIEINFDDGTTDMEAILLTADDCREMTIHTLSGQQVSRTTQYEFDAVWQQIPKGVYIVKGKKLIK